MLAFPGAAWSDLSTVWSKGSAGVRRARSLPALALLLLAVLSPGLARAQGFDPSAYRTHLAGEPTRVLVLGTPHLANMPEGWDPAVLDPLMDGLAAFEPDVITTEDLPGQLIHRLWAYRETYPEVAVHFAGRAMAMADEAKLSLGLDMPQARAAADASLGEWPIEPSPTQRRGLAAQLAAAGDAYSALVQWLRLAEEERVAGDGVSARLADALDRLADSRNESSLIAARLAARVGLERVFPADHQDWEALSPDQAELFYGEMWEAHMTRFRADALMTELIGKSAEMTEPGGAIEAYRFFNDPQVGRREAALGWRDLIATPSEGDVARRRMAGWEMRNMRMAANIREASSYAPGGNVLVIVGAAHKPWLEAYLGLMADVEIVPADMVLR